MQVLHGAPCAVVVAPDELPACRELRQIGVGIDDGPESGVALDLALELARCSGAHLKLLAVVGDIYPTVAGVVPEAHSAELRAPAVESQVEKGRAMIDVALGRCDGVGVSGDVVVGDPVAALTAFGENCDLLVLGSRRWGPVRHLALGSTSEWVIRHATCPVLMPPRHATASMTKARAQRSRASCSDDVGPAAQPRGGRGRTRSGQRPEQGLAGTVARARLAESAPNELSHGEALAPGRILLAQLTSPMPVLLAGPAYCRWVSATWRRRCSSSPSSR